MPLSGQYTTIEPVLDRLQLRAGLSISQSDAIEWIAYLMERVAPHVQLDRIITDGNLDLGHPEPIVVKDYRAQLPCDVVELEMICELSRFRPLRENMSPVARVNFNSSIHHPQYKDRYVPDRQRSSRITMPQSYQLKKGFVYPDFKDGHLVIAYLGWPRDDQGNFLIPADQIVIEAFSWYLQRQIDYRLWRTGEIPDKIFQHTEQQATYHVGVLTSTAELPSDAMMESIGNMWRNPYTPDYNFQTAYASLGSKVAERIH